MGQFIKIETRADELKHQDIIQGHNKALVKAYEELGINESIVIEWALTFGFHRIIWKKTDDARLIHGQIEKPGLRPTWFQGYSAKELYETQAMHEETIGY